SEGEIDPGATITCTAAGVTGDASLESPVTTDEAGEASAELRAGTEAAFLRIRCSTPAALEVVLHVAISPSGGFGALVVSPAYDGTRTFESVLVEVHYGRGCDPLPSGSPHLSVETEPGTAARVEPVP